MKLIVITSDKEEKNEVQEIKAMLAQNLFRLHIRKPQWSCEKFIEFLSFFTASEKKKMSVHSHFEAALQVGVGGVHCTHRVTEEQQDRLVRQCAESVRFISKSCHSILEVQQAQTCDYVFLSPVFRSLSKPCLEAAFCLDQLKESFVGLQTQVFALGGVMPKHLPVLRQCYFSGAATLGYIWNAGTPSEQLQTFLESEYE